MLSVMLVGCRGDQITAEKAGLEVLYKGKTRRGLITLFLCEQFLIKVHILQMCADGYGEAGGVVGRRQGHRDLINTHCAPGLHCHVCKPSEDQEQDTSMIEI